MVGVRSRCNPLLISLSPLPNGLHEKQRGAEKEKERERRREREGEREKVRRRGKNEREKEIK